MISFIEILRNFETMIDPSEIYSSQSPDFNENSGKKFRNFRKDLKTSVYGLYKQMHTYQTVDFVKGKKQNAKNDLNFFEKKYYEKVGPK